MGRYDWEAKRSAREAAQVRAAPWRLAVVACALLFTALGVTTALSDSEGQQGQTGGDKVDDAAAGNSQIAIISNPGPSLSEASKPEPNTSQPIFATFDHCRGTTTTCVVDGDTFWLQGVKIRIADIDTPEVSQPMCPSELQLGDRATSRLIELLNIGPFELHAIGNRDTDRYGRQLRVIVRDGRSLGDQLVAEGLARTWNGRREPWC